MNDAYPDTQAIQDHIMTRLVDAGFSEESSRELSTHMSLHFPQHSEVLLQCPDCSEEPLTAPEP